MNYDEYIKFAKELHAQNVSVGWWDKVRPMSATLDLVHSELSEATEADRKNLMDNHLPHHHGVHAELADALIRMLDMMVFYTKMEHPVIGNVFTGGEANFNDMNMKCRSLVNDVYDEWCHSDELVFPDMCWKVVDYIEYMSQVIGFDLLAIAREKVEYNKTRPDHQRENRVKQGGKSY